ncbi:glutathione S-transferase N-terminal domain-containing protein [Candidatus Curtissbacteria bacterium]|nr:glutathione S-transferase N-terminal domain-containing protein [Candidatus Curtissbacteria bacterium]
MKNVKIYTTSTCYWCQAVKEFFKGKGIKFKEVNVSASPIAQFEMIKKSKQTGVPVIDINGQIIVGFNRSAIEAALKGEKLTKI